MLFDLAFSECFVECFNASRPSVEICASRVHKSLMFNVGYDDCLFRCNVTVMNTGSCACPNHCFGNGRCHDDERGCVCLSGFSGRDCSLFDCSSSVCENKGECAIASDGFGICKCASGFTGFDCSTPVSASLSPPLFPSLFPNEQTWFHDKYGDAHPLFNASAVATIRLELSAFDYEYMIAPANEKNASHVHVTALIHNQVLDLAQKMKMSLKGERDLFFFFDS